MQLFSPDFSISRMQRRICIQLQTEGGEMKIDTKKIMEKAAGASTGLAVAVAFLNVALVVVKLVQTVSEEAPKLEDKE